MRRRGAPRAAFGHAAQLHTAWAAIEREAINIIIKRGTCK